MGIKYVSLIVLSIFLISSGLPKNIKKKVDKEIRDTFEVETFDLSSYSINSEAAKELPSKFETDNFFKINNQEQLLGYVYIAQAPSKTAQFDYVVLLDKELVILKAKVLIYREDYGGEIGSKRWLKQFIGKTHSDELKYGDNIMAISGATISVRSMTTAMNNLLRSLNILHSKQLL
ncbi:FMN-binding protein [Aestuariivivens sediminicola]|uniref:FMN-binding protein n=1 Tax=Aestuariivivens sediminicola TaxID=2913560 RepID=UPI001F59AB6D|nr:FMN-binding protein [Aestuariivivens sediminicola]